LKKRPDNIIIERDEDFFLRISYFEEESEEKKEVVKKGNEFVLFCLIGIYL
jgi:hypothetical protein